MSSPYVTRSQWGARSPSGTGNTISSHPNGVAFHWEGPYMGPRDHSTCDDLMRSIQSFHMDDRGWSDIAYNLCVCTHGYIYEGRGRGKGSAANGSTSANADWYAVCALVGENDAQPVALDNGLADAAAMVRSWGAGSSQCGHRDLYSTSCPGNDIYNKMRSGRYTQSTPQPPPKPKVREDEDMILIYGRSPYLLSGGKLCAISTADKDRAVAVGVPAFGVDNTSWPALSEAFDNDVTVLGFGSDAAAVVSKNVWERYSPGGQNLATWIGDIGQNVDWLVEAVKEIADATGTTLTTPAPVAVAPQVQDADAAVKRDTLPDHVG